ncbi:MAG TPA: DinB family protein [Candidatus Eisenbacteria bacterium]|nr:DinB family protein [Candidatus Eisenbacteria bacterium]
METAVRPAPNEYAPYYGRYVALVPDGPIVETLRDQIGETAAFLGSLPEAKGDHRYEPGKWSVKDVIGHVIDGERVFSYRALRFARRDETPLPGFEQDDYVPAGAFGRRTLRDLIAEFRAVREATLHLYRHLDEEALCRTGIASENLMSVRALAWVIAGHERHHVGVIRERYL